MTPVDRQQAFRHILEQLTANEAVSLALLANDDGLLIAAVPDTDLAQTVAAVGATIHQLAARTAGKRMVHEIAVRFSDHELLVCLRFRCREADLHLSIVVRPNQAYRRIANRAIRQICAVWTSAR